MQYGRFPLLKLTCKFLHELLHTDFLHKFASTFKVTDFACKNTRKLRVFLYNGKMAEVKLETDIVEKHPFMVKKKTTYYTLSLTVTVMFCPLSLLSVPGLEIKKILKSPFGEQLEKYSRQMQIFSLQFV